jgi:hypothetical protein
MFEAGTKLYGRNGFWRFAFFDAQEASTGFRSRSFTRSAARSPAVEVGVKEAQLRVDL